MNWKSIAIHALLLLIVGIAYGIFEPQPTLTAPRTVLFFYLLGQGVLLVACSVIFAHITFRADKHPFAHALLALLLSHEVASLLLTLVLSFMGAEPQPVQLLPLFLFEYALLLVALISGTVTGTHLRRRKLLRSGEVGDAAANA